jgi:hypothetical protein
LRAAILATAAAHADLQALVAIRNDADGVARFNALTDYAKVVPTPVNVDNVLDKEGAAAGGVLIQKLQVYATTYQAQPGPLYDYWAAIKRIAGKFGLMAGSAEGSVDLGADWARDTVQAMADNGVITQAEAASLLSLAVVADPVSGAEYEAALNLV